MMKKFEEEVKRPVIGIEQSSIKPSLGKAIEFYTDKVKEYHNAFNEMNNYIDVLEAQLDYYKKDKRFEAMSEEILSLKSQLKRKQLEFEELSHEHEVFVKEKHEFQKSAIRNARSYEEEIHELKSQLDSQHPEIPEFVAEFIKKYKGNWSLFGAFKNISENKVNNETLHNWVFAHAGKQDLFAQAWSNGYTVAKEKVLVTPCPVCRYEGVDENFCGMCGHENEYVEIDSMAAESYEQIEVEE